MSSLSEPERAFPLVIAARPIHAKQYAVAFAMIGIMVFGLIFIVPLSSIQFRQVDAALPVIQTMISVTCLMTTALLFAQYSIQPDRGLLIVAAGYNCWGIFAFLQTFALPLQYMPSGVIGDGLNSAVWVFWLWHICLPVSVLGYIFTRRRDRGDGHTRSAIRPIAVTIGAVVVFAGVVAWLVTAGVSHLPNLLEYMADNEPMAYYFVGGDLMLTIGVTILLLDRGRTILDLWLIVVLVASLLDLTVSTMLRPPGFSVGWYAARGYAVIASGTALCIMLIETIVLYGRLAHLLLLLQRERADRIMSVDAATATLAHEFRQPLTAMRSSAAAALNWLDKPAPDIGEARAAASAVIEIAGRADAVIASVRELFRRESGHRQLVRIDKVVRESVVLMQADLRANQISIQTKYAHDLPLVRADRLQLQQVMLNIIKNAIEAMSSTPPVRRRLEIEALSAPHSMVRLIIKDSGRGIPPDQQNQIFSSFFTTKTAGMGLGLSICRSIVADHGGTLRVLKSGAGGTTFGIDLPGASNGRSHDALAR